jgi:hypothetical protein
MTTPENFIEWVASLPFDVAVVVLYLPALLLALLGTMVIRWIFDLAIDPASVVGPSKVQYMAEIYGGLLGFLVVVAYTQYDETRGSVRQEVETLRLIERLSEEFEPPETSAVRQAVSNYARAVITDEWPAMAFGHDSESVDDALGGILRVIPRAEDDTVLHKALIVLQVRELVTDVVTARTLRITATPDTNVSDLLSGVLFVVTSMAIGMAWFLRGPSILVHLILTAILVTTFLSLIILGVELIYPFAGDLKVSPAEFQRLIV